MISELFYWVWQLVFHIVTFQWGHLGYHFKNLWWYLRFGYSYSDIMDTDMYIVARLGDMLEKYMQNTVSHPFGISLATYHKQLKEFLDLCKEITSDKFDLMGYEEQKVKKAKFFSYLRRHLFHLWF